MGNVNRNVKVLKFGPGNRTQKWSVHFKTLMECPQDLSLWAKILTKSPKKIILIIPGNPGLSAFYEDFMVSLKNKIPEDYSIWTIAHGGHEKPPPDHNLTLPSIPENPGLFNLQAQ